MTSAVACWESVHRAYHNLVAAYHAANPLSEGDDEEELKYLIQGQDFVFDLNAVVDIFTPIATVMTKLQSFSLPIYKVHAFCSTLLQYLDGLDIYSMVGFPNLEEASNDVESYVFKGVTLLEGWHVTKTTKVPSEGKGRKGRRQNVVDWEVRSLEDCRSDINVLVADLKRSIKSRVDKGVLKISKKLYNCLDFSFLVTKLVGERSEQLWQKPYNSTALALHGRKEFMELIQYISKLEHIENDPSLDFCPTIFGTKIFDSLKDTMASILWGDLFPNVGMQVFGCTVNGSFKSLSSQFSADSRVESFQICEGSKYFVLEPRFSMKIDTNSESINVTLNEEALWEKIYTDPVVYGCLGRELCVVLDFAMSLGGSEAIVESYYSVMETQRKDGGQSNDVLDLRTMIDWCLPPVISVPNTVSSIASLYRSGDVKNMLKKHRSPIYQDPRNRVIPRQVSKVIDKQLTGGSKGFSIFS